MSRILRVILWGALAVTILGGRLRRNNNGNKQSRRRLRPPRSKAPITSTSSATGTPRQCSSSRPRA